MIASMSPFPDGDRLGALGLSPADEVVEVVARATSAGLPLADAIDAYCDERPSSRAAGALRFLSGRLRQGVPLDRAVAATPELPEYVGGLVQAAAGSNRLTLVLEQHLVAARRTAGIRLRFWLVAMYPLVLIAVAITVMVLILGVFVPQISVIFKDFGIPLPGPTKLTIALSDLIVNYWPVALFFMFVGTAVIGSIRLLPGRPWRTRMWQLIPLYGTASRSVGLSEFCSMLALLVECHMPLPQALRLTSGALRDANLAEGSLRLADRCENGLSPDQEVAYLPHFPDSLAPVFRWNSQPDAFVSGLRSAAELYAAQARLRGWIAGGFFQPISLLIIVMMIGSVMLTVFWPLIALLQALT